MMCPEEATNPQPGVCQSSSSGDSSRNDLETEREPSTSNSNQINASRATPPLTKRYFLRSSVRTIFTKMHLNEMVCMFSENTSDLHQNDTTIMETLVAATNVPGSTCSSINPSSLYYDYGPFDISRIPHRVFLRISEARQELRDEVLGLLKKDANGIPVGEVTSSLQPDFNTLENCIPLRYAK